MTKEEILLSLHTLVHAFSDHKRREAVRELHREAANLFDQQAKRIEELERRYGFLQRMNGAIYLLNQGEAHLVEIAETGQDEIRAATLDEALDAAMNRNEK